MTRFHSARVAQMTLAAAVLFTPLVAAGPPGSYSAGPNPLFGSPGAYFPSQFTYPAPGVYGSTVFRPFAVPPLSPSPVYTLALSPEWPAVASARITVRLPADAKLWVDGQSTQQTGATREFVTPPVLRAGMTYQYKFRAEWVAAGQPVTRERTVAVRGTGASEVDFTKP